MDQPYGAEFLIDLRPVFFTIGILLTTVALGMCIPAAVDAAVADFDWAVFFASASITLFVGVSLILTNRRAEKATLTTRQAFLLTVLSWVIVTAFAALPFAFSGLGLSYTDAFFEAMSGITTTGATVITGLDRAPVGILLWRAILQGLGGVGIIVMAVAILPMLRIGGMQLFRTESSDRSAKVLPRVSQIAGAILLVYGGLMVLCTIALWAAGMTFLEAVCHSLSTLSTGGFSTSDASIGHFKSPLIEVILTAFMAMSGMTFLMFVRLWHRDRSSVLRDSQTHWYFALLLVATALVSLWQVLAHGSDLLTAIRQSAFTVVSIVTTTGFASADYGQWGSFPVVLVFVLTFVGGCTGSTAGGIKVFRLQVMFVIARVQIQRLLHPHGVFVPVYNNREISDSVAYSAMGFVFLYLLCFALLAVLLAAFGVDLVTSISGAASALGNVGPGLGALIGPTHSYASLPAGAKWVLALGMLLGRLELLTVIVLFTRRFWRG